MATRKKLEGALIKADAAGDMEAAKAFADELRSMKTTAPSGFARGAMDPFTGLGQMLEKALPVSASKKVNEFNNWLVDKGVPLERMPEGGLDQWVREGEKKYQAARQAAGETGMDWDRLGGNLLSPVNLLAGAAIPKMASLAGRVGAGAAGGAATGAFQPVTEGEFGEEKLKQGLLGMATGGAMPLLTGAASRIIKPKSSPEVQKLLREGVTPTPGQALGGIPRRIEDASRSIPIVGDIIGSAQKRGVKDFNKAVLNRALKPLNKKLDKKQVPDKEALSYVNETISDAYNALLPKLKGKIDNQYGRQINKLRNAVKSMPKDKYNQFERVLKYDVTDRFTKDGLASGATLKEIESGLGSQIKGYMGSQNYDDRRLGQALREVQSQLRLMINRQNPRHKGKLKNINRAYSEFKIAERAQTYTGGDTAFFTPAQYNSAVKAKDISKDKRLFSQGRARGQDLSSAGKDVLSSSIPDSGTAGRVLTTGAMLGAGSINPASLIAPAAATIPYLPGISKGLTGLLARRPDYAGPLADFTKQSQRYLIPGLSQQEQ